jgi:membrane protein implicated in regulation of membrane protease activity
MLVGDWVNWFLVIGGILCVIVELALGAVTGFDMALIGGSMVVGGGIGLLAGSTKIGLLASGCLALIYLAVFRSWLKAKLTVHDQPTNVDAVVGKTAVVTKRIASQEPGMVKLGSELWRAELTGSDGTALEKGTTVKVEAVEGVTLKVR